MLHECLTTVGNKTLTKVQRRKDFKNPKNHLALLLATFKIYPALACKGLHVFILYIEFCL